MRTGPFGSDLLHSEFVEDGVPVIGIDNTVNNRFEWGAKRFISPEKYTHLKRYTLFPRDVIITIMATTGKSSVIPEIFPVAINTKHLAAITVDENKIDPYFLSFSFHSSPKILSQFSQQLKGAIMPGLNLGIIKDLKIFLPPLTEQNKFVLLVKQVENLRVKQRESEKELENLFGSLMQRYFG